MNGDDGSIVLPWRIRLNAQARARIARAAERSHRVPPWLEGEDRRKAHLQECQRLARRVFDRGLVEMGRALAELEHVDSFGLPQLPEGFRRHPWADNAQACALYLLTLFRNQLEGSLMSEMGKDEIRAIVESMARERWKPTEPRRLERLRSTLDAASLHILHLRKLAALPGSRAIPETIESLVEEACRSVLSDWDASFYDAPAPSLEVVRDALRRWPDAPEIGGGAQTGRATIVARLLGRSPRKLHNAAKESDRRKARAKHKP
jgi:hypothetical protein